MKRKVIQFLGQCAFAVLRKVDYYVSGSSLGLKFEEEVANPYRMYGLLRERGHVLRSYTNRGWMVLGFTEVQEVFRDTRFGSDIRKNAFVSSMLRLAANGKEVMFLDNPGMLNTDPPDHTRLRKLVNQGFTNRLVQSLEPRISNIVQQCFAAVDEESGSFDIVTGLAKPLPAIVIAELLGLPEEDQPRFQQLSDDVLKLTALGNDDAMEKGVSASTELTRYFADLIEKKRSHPDQGMISALIAAEEEGDRLTREEMYSTCLLLLIAGHETTTRLIANGMYLLLTHPEQLQKLRDNPALLPNAIEEMLRYEPPVQLMPRFALEDIDFHGHRIRKNQLVLPVIASANRDPDANEDADRFDIERQDIRHVSFGYGIHHCMGLHLARLEARVAIGMLLDRFPEMSLADQDINWVPIPLVRGMENLVINTRR